MTQVELHIYILKDNQLIISPDTIKLLKAVDSAGSLLQASDTLGISYNKAWNMFENLQCSTGYQIAEKVRGGRGGGGVMLTNYGKLLLDEYGSIEQLVKHFENKMNTEINL